MQFKIRTLLIALACSFLLSAGRAQTLPSSGEISSGSTHAVAVRFDGRVFSWGNNANGRLGIGNTTQKLLPTLISGITNVSSASAGGNHTVAVKTDGTVWAWGLNTNGQVGDNTTTQRTSAVQITAINGVISVAAGLAHTLALKQNGTVWAWGLNSDGRLGDNSTSQRLAPVQVSGITGVIAIAAGSTYSLALKSDGTVWAWGDNTNGRLGDGTTTQCLIPVQVSTITQVAAVAAGSSFGLALKTDGTVWAWGDNVNGMLGDGTTTQRLTPVQVNALSAITAISAGDLHALALKNDGSVYAWGNNTSGRLGDGTLINQLSPVALSGLSNISKIRAGADYNLAISADGRVLSWGENASGQLGFGATLPRKTPTQVYTVYPITKMAARSGVGGAIQAGGKLYVWGRNSNGQLGNGTQSASRLPLIHPTIGTLIDVSFGATHALAVKNDGTVWAWGDNTNGRLGDGTTVAKLSPTQVSGLSGITRVAAGGTHSLALKSDGTVWAWGDNTNGRLGDNSTTQRLLPVQVSGLSGVVAIGAGDAHSVALKSDGTVRAWGLNTNGRVGDGTTTQRLLPVQVTGLTSVTSISIGGSHNLARKSDGSVWVWGNNANGRLGDGTTTQKTTAVQLVGFPNVMRVAAGSAHSLAVKSDGTVWAWGLNNSGQLGDSSVTTRTSPVQVPGISDISDIVAGEDNSFALTNKATVWGWGMNASGSLGINEPIFSQAAGLRLISSGSDTDGDGLADTWEISNFGNLAATGAVDSDNDGLTDAQEFLLGTSPVAADQDQDFLGDIADPDPANFFNGVTPSLVALSGGGQVAPPLSVNLQPFEVAIWNSDASYPLINAPLTFSVTSGGGLLSVNASPETPRSNSLQLRADSDGTGRAYYQQPSTDGVSSQVAAASGGATVNFATSSYASPDSDFDGLSDAQEVLLGTNSQVVDTDNDGIPDALEARLGLNPVVADADQVPSAIGGRRMHLRGDLGVTASSSYVTTWADQSGKGNNAIVADTAYRPRQFTNVVNGKPVIRFDGTDDYLQLPNAMSGAAMAEMFIVSKTTIRSGNDESIIYLSSAGATSLPGSNGWLSDGFGSTSFRESGVTTARLTAFNLYNVSAKAGEWTSAINGLPLAYTRSNQVAFMSAPTIGLGSGYFKGDIAEIVVFDHVLTEQERGAMTLYLSNRYALGSTPAAPTNLLATSISSSQINLRWSAVVPSTSSSTYVVERRLGTGDYLVVGDVANALSYVDSGLTPGASYEYRVRAQGLNGVRSAYSNTSAVTTVAGEQALPMEDLGLWLRADAGITDSGAIAAWADQSSRKNNATAIDPATKPTLVANVVNGRSVLRFDGTDDMLQLPSDTMSGAVAGEVFLVSRTSTRVGYSETALTMGLGGSTVLPDYDTIARDGFGSTQQHDLVVNSATFASFNIYNATSLSGLWQAWCNGSLAGRSTTNVVNFGGSLTIGSDGVSYFKGDVAELLVFKRILTDAERNAVTRYLGAKFALGTSASAPTACTATAISSSQVNVQWSAAAPGASAVWYSLERSTEGGPFTVISEATNVFSFVDNGLAGGTSYSYRVRARGLNGVYSAYSPIAAITLPFGGDPLPLNGMRTWLKADAGVDGGALWLDQSGNSNHASADYITSKPARIGNAVNGRPALRFDGADDVLSLPGSLMGGATQGELFIVSKSSGSGIPQPAILLGSGGSTYLPDYDGVVRDGFGSTQSRDIVVNTAALSAFNVYNVHSKAGEWKSVLNANLVAQAYTNVVSFGSSFVVGSDSASFFTGDIAEIIIYDRVLTSGERNAVLSYLAPKYALGSNASTPAGLTAAAVSSTQAHIQWTAVPPSTFATWYLVERQEGVGAFQQVTQLRDSFSFFDDGLTPGLSYTYRVRAKGTNGFVSSYSNSATVTLPVTGTPIPISGIRLWLKAESEISGGTVTSWFDQSGGGNHVVTSPGYAAPTLVTVGPDGRPVVRFNGSSMMDIPAATVATMSAAEVFIVSKTTSIGSPAPVLQLGSGGPSYLPDYDGLVRDGLGSSTFREFNIDGDILGSVNLYSVRSSSGTWESAINGKVAARFTGNTVAFGNDLHLASDGASFFDGDISEVLIYDHILSDAEREAVQSYLYVKHPSPQVVVPSKPVLRALPVSANSADLVWTNEQGLHQRITSRIERSMNGGTYQTIATTIDSITFTDTSLSGESTYTYRVVLSSFAGESPASDPVSVSTAGLAPTPSPSGMKLWLRASTLASTSSVSCWSDSSGNGNDLSQVETGFQPQFLSAQLGQGPAVHFDGIDDHLILPNVLANAVEAELFVVLRVPQFPTQFDTLWYWGQNSTYVDSASGSLVESFGSIVPRDVGIPVTSPTAFYIHNISASSSLWSMRLNGTLQFSSPENVVGTFQSAFLGGDGAASMLGEIAEVIVYDHALNDTQRWSVGRYLASKYGISGISVPAAPTLSIASVVYNGPELEWNTPNNIAVAATIERSVGGGPFVIVATVENDDSYFDSGLTSGETYKYRVKISSYSGSSSYSNEVTVTLPTFPQTGLRLWLQASTCTAGPLANWSDQSGLNNDAIQGTESRRPTVVASALNGISVVRFDGVDDSLALPNVMAGATAGEIFAVVRAPALAGPKINQMWKFGTGEGSSYLNGARYEDFGTNNGNIHNGSPLSTEYHLASVSIGDGNLKESINGLLNWQKENVGISFSSLPVIGGSGSSSNIVFNGDVAEIIVYDHLLSAEERFILNRALVRKYKLPAVPVPATPVLRVEEAYNTSISLEWTAPTTTLFTLTSIERCLLGGDWILVAELENASHFTDTSLTAGNTYQYRVKVRGLAGVSSYSNTVVKTTPLISATLASGTASSSGAWASVGGSMVARSMRGAISYDLNVPSASLYALDITVRDAIAANPERSFEIDLYIDGVFLTNIYINAIGSTQGVGRVILPSLAPGNHSFKIVWHNGMRRSFLQIDSVQLINIDTLDSNADGVFDWVTSYNSAVLNFDSQSAQSYFSPFTMEGMHPYPEFLKARWARANFPSETQSLVVRQGLDRQFYVRVPLQADVATIASVYDGSGLQANKSISWIPFNLGLATNAKLSCIKGSTVLITSFDRGAISGASEVSIVAPDLTTFPLTVPWAEVQSVSLPAAGLYKFYVSVNGGTSHLALTVESVTANLTPAPLLFANYYQPQSFSFSSVPRQCTIQASEGVILGDELPNAIPRMFSVYNVPTKQIRFIARLGASGPIIDSAVVTPLRSYEDEANSMQEVAQFPDGSAMYRAAINFEGSIPPDIEVHMMTFTGAIFLDGTTHKTFTAADFDPDGKCYYYMIAPFGGHHICHTVSVMVGGVEVYKY